MPNAYILHELQYPSGTVIDGSERSRTAFSLASGALYRVENVTVADNYGSAVLWTTGDGGFMTFDTGYILSTQDIWVELRTDNGTPKYPLLLIKANRPFYFGSEAGGDTTESLDGAVLVDGTDYDGIDRIEVQRNVADGEGDASVTLILMV